MIRLSLKRVLIVRVGQFNERRDAKSRKYLGVSAIFFLFLLAIFSLTFEPVMLFFPVVRLPAGFAQVQNL